MLKMLNNLVKCTTILILVSVIEPSSQISIEEIENAFKFPKQTRDQLFIDLLMLSGSVTTLQGNLTELNQQLSAQSEVIRHLQLQFSINDNAIDECDMAEFFYGIDSKLVKIKQKIQNVINDNDEEYMDLIDKIIHNVRKTSLECSMDGRDLFVDFQTNITAKLMVFEKQMKHLNVLEQRFLNTKEQEQKAINDTTALTNLLKEIKGKLSSQEEKLNKLEFHLPLILNATQMMVTLKENENFVCNKQKCISQKIVQLTKA